MVEKNAICCHNCGWYSKPYQWVVRITGLSFTEIQKDIDSTTDVIVVNTLPKKPTNNKELPVLPADSINLLDQEQTNFYNDNSIVLANLKQIKDRKLNTAVNRPIALYTTLTDKVHNNRLIIPFYDTNNKIVFYQSRKVLDSDERPKYLSKVGAEKSFYGINVLDPNIEHMFITEGPIDAMFIKNGVAVAGINEGTNNNFTSTQKQQLLAYPLHNRVWVLDNQYNDNTSKKKTCKLLEEGEHVFIWPESFKNYKDINEYCVDKNINSFDIDTILENTYTGLKGKLLLSRI